MVGEEHGAFSSRVLQPVHHPCKEGHALWVSETICRQWQCRCRSIIHFGPTIPLQTTVLTEWCRQSSQSASREVKRTVNQAAGEQCPRSARSPRGSKLRPHPLKPSLAYRVQKRLSVVKSGLPIRGRPRVASQCPKQTRIGWCECYCACPWLHRACFQQQQGLKDTLPKHSTSSS